MGENNRTLVVQTSFIGDMVLTTPLFEYLDRIGRKPDVLATPGNAALIRGHPHVRDVVVYDKRGKDRGLAGFSRIGRELRKRKYTTAYFAQGSMRSAALGVVAGIGERVGFDTSAGRRLYNHVRPYDETRHHADRLLSLAIADARADRPLLAPGDAERREVDSLFQQHGYEGEPLVALAPGSIWGTKRWPLYAELAGNLSKQFRLLIIGGKDDGKLAEAIVARAGNSIDATGKLSLLASAEAIARCVAIVTNDSAPQHLASAVGTPTVAIFGPTVPEFGFGPLAPSREVLGINSLPCRPCDRHGPQECPLGHWRCMREIDVQRVRDSVERIIARS